MRTIKSGILGLILLVVVASALFLTCDVGLGDSVDTKPPTVAIAYPPVQSIIKNSFTMSGAVSDDTSLASVTVGVLNTVTAATYGPYEATIDAAKTGWSLVVNNRTDSGYELRDGTYEMTVTAVDGAGRKSVATTTYEIDNTAPVVVIERPGTNGPLTSVKPEVYGTELKITGSINDDHAIDKLVFTAYDSSGNVVASPITQTNISGVAMDITLAKSFKAPATNDEVALNALYDALHNNPDANGTQNYYCTITASDSAREYNPPAAIASADNTRGNINSVYYVYDDVYSTIFAATGYAVTMKDLTAMFNGSYADAAKSAAVLKALASMARPATTWSTGSATFSLNPNNSPTYELKGFSPITAENPISGMKKTNATDLTILISAGRDGVPMLPDTFRVSLDPCGSAGDTPVNASDSDNIVLLPTVAELGSDTAAVAARNLKCTKTGSDYSVFVNIGSITTKQNYLLRVSGTDQNGNSLVETKYGFRVITNGKPPVITFTGSTPANLATINNTSVSVEGTVVSETGLSSMPGAVSIRRTSDSAVIDNSALGAHGVDHVSPTGLGAALTATNWSMPIDTSLYTTESDSYEYTVTMTATDEEGNSTLATRIFYIDREKPQAEFTSETPIVKVGPTDYVNGIVTMNGRVTDNDKVATATYSINGSFPQPLANFSNWSLPVDTRAITATTGTLTLSIAMTDRAGNTNTATKTLNIDQSTDKPVIILTNADTTKKLAGDVTASVNLFGTTSNNKLLGTITDDDKLGTSMQVLIDGVTADPITIATPGTSYSLYYTPTIAGAALSEGTHRIEIIVSDNGGVTQTTGEFYIGIDAGDPSLAITEPVQNDYYSGTITVKGTASDGSGVVNLVRKEASPPDTAVTINASHEWEDPFNVGTVTGSYSRTYVATDKYGRTTNAVFSYQVDATPPTVGITTAETFIKKENVFQIEGTSGDVGSSVSAVLYKVKAPSDAVPTAVDGTWITAVGTSPWTVSVNLSDAAKPAGDYVVYVASKDRAGNYSTLKSVTLHVDGDDPVITPVSLPAAYVHGTIAFTISASDANLDTLTYTRTGLASPVTIADPASHPINDGVSVDGTYVYTFTATDKAGHKATYTVSTVNDNAPPEIEISSITKQLTANSRSDNVNGTITVKGTISDNDKVQTGTYTLSVGDKDVPSFTDVSGFVKKDVGSNLTSWTFTIDTTAAGLTDAKDLRISLNATDRAGNTAATVSQIVHIDQSTDIPVVTMSNVDVAKTHDTDVKEGVNLFGTTSNNKLLGTITDDDGLANYQVIVKDHLGATTSDTTTALTGSPTTWSITYSLPAAEDVYSVTVKTTDCMSPGKSATIGPFFVGVDAGDPSLKITEPSQNEYYKGTITIKGTASDGSGVVNLVRKESSPPDTGVAVNGATHEWSNSLDVGTVSGYQKKTFVATDKYGRATTAIFEYYVDATPPTVGITTAESYIKKENVFQVIGTALDHESSVSAVYYSVRGPSDPAPTVSDASWKSAIGTESWTASINLSDAAYVEGTYTVYVVSKDRAGNYSDPSQVTVHADVAEPSLSVTPPSAYMTGSTVTFAGSANDLNFKTLTYSRTGLASPVTIATPASWTLNDSVTADGTYSYTFTASDLAGRSKTYSYTVVRDTVVPTIEISSITKQISANGRDDNVNGKILVKGTISDNDKVQTGTYTLSIGDKAVPSSFADVTGFVSQSVGPNLTSWAITIDTTSAGLTDTKDLKISINATDRAGNPAVTVPQVVHIDQSTDKPIVAVTSPAAGAYVGVNTVVRGTISDDDGVDTTKLEINYNNGSTWSGWTRIDTQADAISGSTTDKTFKYTLPDLGADGIKQVQIRGSDIDASNDAITAEPIAAPAVSFSIDTHDPVITIENPTVDDTAHNASFEFSGKVDEAGLDTIKISVDGGSKTTLKSGGSGEQSWTYTPLSFSGLSQGRHTVTLEAVDKVGRSAAAQRSFFVDTEGPTITFSNLTKVAAPATAPAILTPDTIRGTVSDKYSSIGAKFSYRFDTDDAGVWTQGDILSSTWSVSIPDGLSEGEHTITVQCADALDNASVSDPIRFRVDRAVPTITFTPPAKTLYNDDYSLSGSSSDANGIAKIDFYVDDAMKSSLSATTQPWPWGYTVPVKSLPQAEGSHTLKIVATDTAGRTSQTVFSYTVDNTAPIASITGITPLADKTMINGIAKIAASATDDNGVDGYAYAMTATSVTDGATIDASAWTSFAANSSTINFDTTVGGVAWDDKTWRIWVRAKDKAGNSGYSYQDRRIDQDSDRPVVKLSNVLGDSSDAAYPTTLKNSNILYGTVTDDDGVTSIKMKCASGEAWQPITLEGSSWEYSATGTDGAKALYFQIVDETGRVYETSAAATVATVDADKNPVVTGRPRVQKAVDDYLDNATAITFKVDTVPPEIGSVVSADRAASFDFASDSNTVPMTTNLGFGGTSSTFRMRMQASDANGIKAVTVKLDGASGTSAQATFSPTWTNAPVVAASSIVKDGMYRIATTAGDTDFTEYGAASNAVGVVFQALVAGKAGDTATVQAQVYDSEDISVSGLADGSAVATITVEDNSGLKSTASRTIIVDKTKPQVFYSNPKSRVDQLNGEVSVTGSASDDGSGLSSIKYQTGLCADLDPASTKWVSATGSFSWQIDYKAGGNGKIEDYTGPSVTLDAANHAFVTIAPHGFADGTKVYFGGAGTLPTVGGASLDCSAAYYVLPDADSNPKTFQVSTTKDGPAVAFIGSADNLVVSKYAVDANNDGIWELPIVMRAEDVVGNVYVSDFTTYVLLVDPSADRPTVKIVYPAEGQTLGGIIRIFGTAADDDAVKEVYMQIDANGDGLYTSADDKFGTSAINWYNGGAGQLVSGAASWNQTINDTKEFNPTGEGTRTIHFRVRAKDINDPAVWGAWSDSREIKVDNNVPKIGSSSPLRLVQYNPTFTAETASQPYVDGMFIRGTWYLVGSIEDESGIDSVTVSSSLSGDLGTNDGASGKWFTAKDYASGTMHGYEMRIPLATSGSGAYTIKIDTTDKSTPMGTNQRTLTVKYDNAGPVQASYSIASIVQSNKVYTISSNLTEGDSGLDKIAFYFERNVSDDSKDRVYNVMESRVGDANLTYLSSLTMINGLPCFTLGTYSLSADKRSLTSAALSSANTNVRVGGLAYFGGMFRRIDSMTQDASSGTITWADAATDTGSAAIAYAMVVDNTTQESVVYDTDNVTIKKIVNDDGDKMPESIVKTSTTYAWDATFNSKNIPDGPIELHIVAFDKAGNYTEQTVTTSVQNNRPKIASVILGTDLNGDGDTGETGETITYSALDGSNNPQAEVTIGSGSFIAKGMTSVKPAIIGGNGKLQYTLKVGAATIHSLATIRATEVSAVSEVDITEAQLKGVGEGSKDFIFKIWDSTEEMKPGYDDATSSQYAILTAPFTVDVVDDVAPKAVIQPFFWRGKGDKQNSLYQGLPSNGHIEIPDDDAKNPAVSGTISVRGTAYDNQRVEAIYMQIDDKATATQSMTTMTGMTDSTGKYLSADTFPVNGESYVLVATFINGSWSCVDRFNAEGWKFTASTVSLNQSGHVVSWQFDWDTSKISKIADDGQNIRIVCLDRTPTSSYSRPVEQDLAIDEADMIAGETYLVTSVETGTPTMPLTSVGASANKLNNLFVATGPGNGNGKVRRYTHKPSYTVDVVPYISAVTTTLSQYYKNAPSVFNRTALGHYPVYAGSTNANTPDPNGETISISGFNFNGASTGVYLNGTTSLLSIATDTSGSPAGTDKTRIKATIGLDDAAGMKSGPLTVSVNGQVSRNNDATTAKKEYNLLPNNVNNNLLNDDVYLDVWQFTEVGWSKGGGINNPNMKVSPKGQIGFSYGHSVVYFSMPGLRAGESKYYSQTAFQKNYGWFTSNDFAFDAQGNTYGSALCPDTSANPGYTANYTFYSRMAQRAIANMNLDDNYQSYRDGSDPYRSFRLANTSMKVDTDGDGYNDDNLTNIFRVKSPSMATTMVDPDSAASGTNLVRVYIAYYDDLTKEVRFRYGTVGANPENVSDGLNDLRKTDRSHFDNFNGPDAGAAYYQVVASDGFYNRAATTTTQAFPENPTAARPGEYVALAAQRINSTKDVVMIAWYDSTSRELYFSYNDDPMNVDNQDSRDMWQKKAIVVDSSLSSGQNVKMVVDGEGGVHIAYYTLSGGDLKYAYLSAYDDKTADVATVDSYLSVGTNCTIDVAKSGGHQVPFIGYYMGANSGTSACNKVAYRVNFATNTAQDMDGADSSSFYTGNWEISIVPEKTTVIPTDTQVSVGVYRDPATGALKAIPTGSYKKETGETNGFPLSESTIVYGNGSLNPVVSYATKAGVLKMAQKLD